MILGDFKRKKNNSFAVAMIGLLAFLFFPQFSLRAKEKASASVGKIENKNQEVAQKICTLINKLSSSEFEKKFSSEFKKQVDYKNFKFVIDGIINDFGQCLSASFDEKAPGFISVYTTHIDQSKKNHKLKFSAHYENKKSDFYFTGLLFQGEFSAREEVFSSRAKLICEYIKNKKLDNYEAFFDKNFRDQITLETMNGVFAKINEDYSVCEDFSVVSIPDQELAFQVFTSNKKKDESGAPFRLHFIASLNPDNKFTSLLFRGDLNFAPYEFRSTQEMKDKLASLFNKDKGNKNALYFSVNQKVLVSENENVSVPLGSAFKLFVLYKIASDIKLNKYNWDYLLNIQNKYKSLPSGQMQNLKEGSRYSIYEYALKMISISDNTATDHLMNFVGKRNLENFIISFNEFKNLQLPFLTTKEMFATRANFSLEEFNNYNKKSFIDKLNIFKNYDYVPISEIGDKLSLWKDPKGIYDIEWFSDAKTMCFLMQKLDDLAKKDDKLFSILSANTPFVGPAQTRYSFYKGGSEPGVLTTLYYGENNAGEKYCAFMHTSNAKSVIEEDRFFKFLSGVLNFFLK